MWGDGFELGYGVGFEGVELVWLFLVVGLFGGVDASVPDVADLLPDFAAVWSFELDPDFGRV